MVTSKTPKIRRVIGVDPGSRKMGLAVIEGTSRKMRAVSYATVRFKSAEMVDRLQTLHDRLAQWLETYEPEAAAVEDVFVRNNVRSALVLGQARGAALLALGRSGLKPVGYAPAAVKRAVAGHGRAGKHEVRTMVRIQLGLDRVPAEDAADALAVAMTHLLEDEMRQAVAATVDGLAARERSRG